MKKEVENSVEHAYIQFAPAVLHFIQHLFYFQIFYLDGQFEVVLLRLCINEKTKKSIVTA